MNYSLGRFNELFSLTEEEQHVIESYLIPKKLRKKQFLLQEGDVCNVIVFVEKGALRSYVADEKGIEHIIHFALKRWTITDLGIDINQCSFLPKRNGQGLRR